MAKKQRPSVETVETPPAELRYPDTTWAELRREFDNANSEIEELWRETEQEAWVIHILRTDAL